LSEGSACAADFWAGLGVLASFCPLGETLQAAPINITARAPATAPATRLVQAAGGGRDIWRASDPPVVKSRGTVGILSSMVARLNGTRRT